MNRRLILAAACAFAIGGQAAFAQALATPPPQAGRATTIPNAAVVTTPQPPPPPPAPATPAAQGQRVNVKVEFTITDQRGAEPPVKRAVSVITADGNLGRVRSIATAIINGMGGNSSEVPLNVDANPTLLNDGKIKLQFTLSYDLPVPSETTPGSNPYRVTKTAIQDSVTLMLENGKSMIAAQSADPIGDRTVTVEVKATILR
jgi:hypothetical protein